MDRQERQHLRATLAQTVLEFFRDYGVECSFSEAAFSSIPPLTTSQMPPHDGQEVGAVIGLRSANQRGGFAFVAPAELVARLLPVPEQEHRRESQLRDWSVEMANQLAGRLKNKLSARDFDIDVSVAAPFDGSSMRMSFAPSAEGLAVRFTVGSVDIRVYLDCCFDPGDLADPEGSTALPEGDLVVF